MGNRDILYGSGFDYPLQFSESTGGASPAEAVRSVVASITRILDTAPGEDQFNPQFGCGLKFIMFENDTDLLRIIVTSVISEAIYTWEPRVQEILGVDIDRDDATAPNTLRIRVYFRLIQDQEVNNFVYPYSIPS